MKDIVKVRSVDDKRIIKLEREWESREGERY